MRMRLAVVACRGVGAVPVTLMGITITVASSGTRKEPGRWSPPALVVCLGGQTGSAPVCRVAIIKSSRLLAVVGRGQLVDVALPLPLAAGRAWWHDYELLALDPGECLLRAAESAPVLVYLARVVAASAGHSAHALLISCSLSACRAAFCRRFSASSAVRIAALSVRSRSSACWAWTRSRTEPRR